MSTEEKDPSKVEERKEWLLCGLEDSRDRLPDYIEENQVSDPKTMDCEELDDYENPKVEEIDKSAVEDEYLSGKWEIAVSSEKVDQVWNDVKKLIEKNKIWGAQVNTRWIVDKRNDETHTIRVYTPNFLDEDDVLRVGKLLKKRCKIDKGITYKPDIYNALQIYSEEGEDMKLPKEIRYEL
ncbi:MAG: putative phosphothreonine lyase domain-containing protein [Candidatus Natronoplasma sp.]